MGVDVMDGFVFSGMAIPLDIILFKILQEMSIL